MNNLTSFSMIKCFFSLAVFLTLTSPFSSVNAQKAWTLEECIKYAWDNNIQIKRQELQTEISKNNFEQSKMTLLPDLNVGGNHNWGFGRHIDQFTNQYTNSTVVSDNFYAQSTIVLFNGFQQINSIEQNKYILNKSLQDYEKAKNDISMQIATAYLQILFGEDNLIVAQQQIDLSHQQTEKMNKLVEVGSKAKGDMLIMQAAEANDKYNYVTAKNNLTISYLTLSQLLELKLNDDFKIKKPDSLSIESFSVLTSVDDIYKDATVKLPQVKSAEYDLMSYEKSLSIAKGQMSPKITLTGGYSNGYSDAYKKSYNTGINRIDTIGFVNANNTLPVVRNSPIYGPANYSFWDQIRDNGSKSLTIGINIPVFNRFQTKTNISNAKIRVSDSQYNLEQTKKGLYKEIETAHADAVAALEKYYSASEAVKSNEEAFKYSQQKYDVGMLSAVDYNLAKTNLIKSKSDLIQAKYQYIFKVKILDFYKGLPITL